MIDHGWQSLTKYSSAGHIFVFLIVYLIGCLTKDKEVTDIWSVWELHSVYAQIEVKVVVRSMQTYHISLNYRLLPSFLGHKQLNTFLIFFSDLVLRQYHIC